LQALGVEVRHGFTRNGKSKGISYSFLGQAFSGSHLGAAYTFPGLQKHKGVSYQPRRDDIAIKQLLLNPVNYVAATGFDSCDGFAMPLATFGIAFSSQTSSERERDYYIGITDVIGNTDSEDSDGVKNATDIINAQSDAETALILDRQNTVNSQNTIDRKNNGNKTTDITSTQNNESAPTDNREEDEAVSLPEQWRVIYQQICLKLEQFSDSERDYLIVKRLLQLRRPPEEIKEIINASPIQRTQSEVKELMVRANLELLSEHQKQLRQQKKLSELEL
jgi:hypothetical protein